MKIVLLIQSLYALIRRGLVFMEICQSMVVIARFIIREYNGSLKLYTESHARETHVLFYQSLGDIALLFLSP